MMTPQSTGQYPGSSGSVGLLAIPCSLASGNSRFDMVVYVTAEGNSESECEWFTGDMPN